MQLNNFQFDSETARGALYKGKHAYAKKMMQLIALRVPLTHFITNDVSTWTRESVINFARRTCKVESCEDEACEVHVLVTVDHEEDGLVIEVASVELIFEPGGNWQLQYVSHPAQSLGLTAAIVPNTSDFVAFIRARDAMRLPGVLTPLCASEMEAEGLGPLAALNLRHENGAPVVPSRTCLDQLVAVAAIEPTLQR